MRIISTPKKELKGPPHPPWILTFWMRQGTVVEYKSNIWELDITGAADQVVRVWRKVGEAVYS